MYIWVRYEYHVWLMVVIHFQFSTYLNSWIQVALLLLLKRVPGFLDQKNVDELIKIIVDTQVNFWKENIPNKWPKLQLTLCNNNNNNQSTWQNMQSSLILNGVRVVCSWNKGYFQYFFCLFTVSFFGGEGKMWK